MLDAYITKYAVPLENCSLSEMPNFKFDQNLIEKRLQILLLKVSENLSIKDLVTAFNDNYLLKFPRKKVTEQECVKNVSDCSIQKGQNLSYIGHEFLHEKPKERFDQLFSLKKEWYHAEIERFFET